jgi:uncharacterized protein
MRAVVDTNVLVSELINPVGAPAQIVDAIRAGTLIPVISSAVLAEYQDVLRRPRFGFRTDWVDGLLSDMVALSLIVNPDAIHSDAIPDPDDRVFIALARSYGCPVVTGNIRHFPPEVGVDVLTPRECLAKLD